VSERVFERANNHHGLLARWCAVTPTTAGAFIDAMVHQ
jgi:hypothetical protein